MAVCCVSRGVWGGVKLVAVGVQFQPAPSRQAKGGVFPNQSAETGRNEYFFLFLLYTTFIM